MEIGKQIYELRKNANLSQERLAEKVGVSRQTISKWELGETSPDIKQAQMLSRIFNVSLDKLTGNEVEEVVCEKLNITEGGAGVLLKLLKIFGVFIIVSVIISVICIILFSNVRKEGSVENNIERVTITEAIGDETYIITIGADGYFEGVGMTEEIKEDIMDIIIVGDLASSAENITDYFIKLREDLRENVP